MPHPQGEIVTASDGSSTQCLEHPRRLPESLLWRLQETYYQENASGAWNVVPYYPTSNAFIGDTYAALIVAALFDSYAQLSLEHPIYIVELAAGSGCFSFYLLQALLDRVARLDRLANLRICYVMTDLVEGNLDAWLQRPELRPYFESGMLDLATFAPDRDRHIFLRRHQVTLGVDGSDSANNPWFFIANYFFDTIHQDFFRVENGRLLEGRVALTRSLKDLSPDEPIRISQVTLEEEYVQSNGPLYLDPDLNALVEDYRTCGQDMNVLFPTGPLEVLRTLRALSLGRYFLISSDKGFCHRQYLERQRRHLFAVHGSFSFMVNYDALGRDVRRRGGVTLFQRDLDPVVATVFFAERAGLEVPLELTRYTFAEKLERRNDIHDFFVAHRLLRAEAGGEDELADSYVGLIRAGAYDPLLFESCAPQLYARRKDFSSPTRRRILDMLPRVHSRVYPMRRRSYRALYWLGRLYYGLNEFDAALEMLLESLDRVDPQDSNTLYYAAACHECMGDDRSALEYYLLASAFDPDCQVTRNSIQRVQGRLDADSIAP